MVIYMVLMYTLLPSVAGSVSDEGKLLFFPLVADFDPEHRDIVSSVYWLSMAVQISVDLQTLTTQDTEITFPVPDKAFCVVVMARDQYGLEINKDSFFQSIELCSPK